MSRSLGVLTLDLIARTGNFDQGMDRASRRVRATANEMEAARRVADRMVAGIAAAAAGFATAAVAMTVSAARSMDATSKMAQQIGTTTESLTGMRFAAQQFADISDQQFDMSMRRMTRRIAEAAEGSGAAKGALDAMGLSARELARLAPDQQMLAIADAMQKTERQADRLRYTMALFDTEGMALVPALQQGAAAFEANIALARQFGVVVSQEAASAAEEFMTNMNLLTEAQKGFKNQVAESVLPVLAEFTGYLVDIAKNAGDMAERADTALKVVGVAAAGTATIITSRLVASILKKVGAWGAATIAAARLQAQMTSLSASIAGASRVVSASAGLAAGAATALGRAGQLALGVLGGPVGLAAAAAITGAAFLAMGRDSKTAATDVDELTRSLENLNRRQLESAAFNLENELVELSKQAEGHSQILRGMRNDYDELAKTQDRNSEGMRNARQSIREEEEAFESVIATIAKKSPLLAQITQRLWDLDTASRGAAGGVDTLNRAMGFSEAGEKYLAQIQGRIKALQDAGDPIKIASRYIAEHTELTEADRVAIMSAAHAEKALIAARDAAAKATKAGTNAINEAKRAAEAFRREQDQGLRAQLQAVSAIHQQAGALEDQVALFGQSKTALEDLTIARLEEQAAMLRGFDGSQEQVEAIEREIEARKRLRTAIGSLEQKEAERQAWEDWARDVEQIFDRVGQSLTDAIFDGGKSGKELLKDVFKGLTFNILINPVMKSLQGMVTNQLGGMFGFQNPQQSQTGGLNPLSLFTNFEGSVADSLLNVGGYLYDSSNKFISDLGASLFRNADAIGKFADTAGSVLGYGKAIYDLTQGNYGRAAGAAIGTYFGGPVGAFFGGELGGLVDGIFDREPTTRREQRTQVEYADGALDITKRDDRVQAGADQAVAQMTAAAIDSANSLFQSIGIDATIESFRSIMASSYKRDRDGVASGGTLRVGDQLIDFGITDDTNPTLGGFGGWSSVDPMQRIGTEIQLSMLEAFQSVSDQLPGVLSAMLEGIDVRSLGEQEAQALAERFTMLTQGASQFLAAIETMPFAELRDLTFDAAAGMVQFAGGLENLVASQQTYYERFYSDAERHAHSVDQLTQALAGVGVEMPALVGSTDDMLASYRAMVESLDLNTEAGQQAYVTLMQVSGAFADVAQFAGQAAVESQRLADQQRQAMQALRQSFVGLAGDALAAIQQHGQERIAKLSESFGRTDAILSAYRTQVQQLESQWGSLITTMQRSMRDLRGQVEASARLQYDQARAVISTALLTGQLPQTADLGEAIRVAQQGVTGGRYASAFDQREAYLKLANELEVLQGIAQPELDTARASLAQLEKQYNRLRGIEDLSGLSLKQLEKQFAVALSAEAAARTQIEQIERQIAMAQLQYQQLVGINDELSTLPGALRALAKAVDAASRVPAESTAVNREARYLANNPDVLAAYVRGDWGVQTAEEAARYHWEKYGKYEGRSFDVGTPYVPYDMMANIHRGEIIIDPRSSDILRRYGIGVQGGGTSRETERLLREQLAEVRQQNRYLYEIVKSGKRNERNTEDVAMAIAHGGSDDVLLVTY